MYHLTSNISFFSNLLKRIGAAAKVLFATVFFLTFTASAIASTTVGESSEFTSSTNESWTNVITLARVSDGASSQGAQTLSINVTGLPEGGANYRVYKTTANGSDFFGNAQELFLGNNFITVAGVAFDRAVKIQLSSPNISFDTLSVNGDQLYPEMADPVDPQAGITAGESTAFSPTTNPSWTRVITLTLISEGASSQAEQTLSMNVTDLPVGGASYRVYKTTANGSDFFANAQDLVLGNNTVTVAAVAFDRAVKIQLSSANVRFDALSVNGAQLYPEAPAPEEPAAGITLGDSSAFYDKDHATWVKVIDLALVADGASSQGAQTLSINVTELPEGGATYRVYKTTANGNDFFGDAQELVLGNNIVTVAGVAFDRAVKLQFSSSDIRFDVLSVNGDQLYPEVTDPEDPQAGITAGESSAFTPTTNADWPRVINLTLINDGASSQAEQTLSMNVTELPEGGASYRVYKTTANGSDFFANAQDLVLGDNTITVAAVAFDRAVKVQLSSVDVRFDALSINETQIYPEPERIDSDNDGVFDDEDAFPDDPAESVDTDNDGIGNNSDTDDDGDGVEDGLDGDPLDPNVGELPKQMISVSGNPSAMPGKATSVTVSYNASDNDETLTGLGLKVHYNSSVLNFVEFAEVFAADNIDASGPFEDTDDADNDSSTDMYLSASWAALFGDWPGQLPESLLTINFNTAEEVSVESTTIGFSSVSTAASHGFAPEAYDMPISEGSWDFDNDGNADALTDGLLLLRYTFGLRGASLTDGAIASGSSLTLEEVEANVADSTTSFADIDGSDNVDALTDGLMMLRYLFGLRGASLIDGAVATGASRQSAADVEAYIISLMP